MQGVVNRPAAALLIGGLLDQSYYTPWTNERLAGFLGPTVSSPFLRGAASQPLVSEHGTVRRLDSMAGVVE